MNSSYMITPLRGDCVSINGFALRRFERFCFCEFEVFGDLCDLNFINENKDCEVEIATITNWGIRSSATVKLASFPEILGNEFRAVFNVVYQYSKLEGAYIPKGGNLEIDETEEFGDK